VFVNRGTLFAILFDLRRLETAGEVFPVLEEVVYSSPFGAAQFDVSRNGQWFTLRVNPIRMKERFNGWTPQAA
jgi:hypothetical protein